MGSWISLACIVLGGLLVASSLRTKKELRRYNFDNTTDGGVVRHPTFEAAEVHESRERSANNWGAIGAILVIGGLVTLFG